MVLETISKTFAVIGGLLGLVALYHWAEFWMWGPNAWLMSEALTWTFLMVVVLALAKGLEKLGTSDKGEKQTV